MTAEIDEFPRKGFLLETRKRLGDMLSHRDYASYDQKYFSKGIWLAIHVCHIPLKEIATHFRVSQPTVGRWSREEAMPGTFTRQKVIEWLANRLKEPVLETALAE